MNSGFRKIITPTFFNSLKMAGLLAAVSITKWRAQFKSDEFQKGSLASFYRLLQDKIEKPNLQCYKADDKELKRVRADINQKIKDLEFKYQGTMRKQNVNFGIRGNRYYMEFSINQANVNPEQILNAFLNAVNPSNKPNPKADKNSEFRIVDQAKVQEDDIYTIKLDFEVPSSQVSHAKSPGSLYIRGAFGKVYDNFVVCLEKQNDFNTKDIEGFIAAYEEALRPKETPKKSNKKSQGPFNVFDQFDPDSRQDKKSGDKDDPISILQKHGVTVFQPGDYNKNLDWGYLAGYENVKRLIEDSILLGLTHGEIYDQITSGTRVKFETNRPKAILFEGPPGCGKTTSAKIIADQVNIPLIYMPLEAIMSKWYGESENKFSDIFEAAKALGKSIIFIDEIDALATSREGGIHEATRRILSTLLRKIDGFESDGEVLVICATNRRKDLDAALLSRLDITITFDLPDRRARALIFQKYAKQLKVEELENLSELSESFSGRDIADVCKDAERRWASKYIRKETKDLLPSIEIYRDCLNERMSYTKSSSYLRSPNYKPQDDRKIDTDF